MCCPDWEAMVASHVRYWGGGRRPKEYQLRSIDDRERFGSVESRIEAFRKEWQRTALTFVEVENSSTRPCLLGARRRGVGRAGCCPQLSLEGALVLCREAVEGGKENAREGGLDGAVARQELDRSLMEVEGEGATDNKKVRGMGQSQARRTFARHDHNQGDEKTGSQSGTLPKCQGPCDWCGGALSWREFGARA